MTKRQVRLSHLTFAMLLEELLSGPCTVKYLAEHSGMGEQYVRKLMRTMHARKVVHIAGWDKDCRGRMLIRVFGLGPGKDAKRVTKPRNQVNKDYSAKKDRALLQAAFAPIPPRTGRKRCSCHVLPRHGLLTAARKEN